MTADAARSTAMQRLPNGQFAAGNSGRIPGTRNKLQRETLLSVQGLQNVAIGVLKANLANGDMRAAELVLSYCLPKGRTVELDGGSPGDIVAALVNAEISPEEAKHIATAVARLRELDELDALRERLTEIEGILKDGK